MSQRVGINRPKRIFEKVFDSNDRMMRHIASVLDKHTRKSITTARLNIMEYPFVKLQIAAANINSGGGNTVTFASAAFDPPGGAADTANPEQFGVRKGMVIAELDAVGEVERYAYIASTGSDNVVYGNSSTDTSDGTALDKDKDMAIFVPVEVGHTVRVTNNTWNKNINVLITEIKYTLSSVGIINCALKGVGLEDNSVGVIDVALSYQPSHYDNEIDMEVGVYSGQGRIIDGKISSGHSDASSTEHYRTLHVANTNDATKSIVTVMLPDGHIVPMDTGNITIPTISDSNADYPNSNKWHKIFLRPEGDVSSPLSGDNKDLQILIDDDSANAYQNHASVKDLIFGRVRADDDQSVGSAILDLQLFDIGDRSVDVSQIPQNRLTSALIKKGAQTYSTDLQIVRSTNAGNNSYKHIKWHGGTSATTNATIKFADGTTRTIAYGGDSDNDAANEADYSFTTDGETYTTKDNLESTELIGGSAGAITLFAYIDLDQTGNLTLRLTNDNLVPYADNHVILGVITVASSSPAPLADTAPFIAPFTEKFLAINATVISANAITANEIASQISWSKIFRLASGGLFETGEGVGGGLAGVKIDSTGVYGVNGASTGVTQFHLKAADGTASCLAGDVVFDANGITIKSTNKDNQALNFVQKGTTTYTSGSSVSDFEIARIGAEGGALVLTTKAFASPNAQTTRLSIGETQDSRAYNFYLDGKIYVTSTSLEAAESGTALVLTSGNLIKKSSSSFFLIIYILSLFIFKIEAASTL